MSTTSFDIEQLYQKVFGSNPFKISESQQGNDKPAPYTVTSGNSAKSDIVYDTNGSVLSMLYKGTEIWLPTMLRGLPTNLFETSTFFLPYCVMRISGGTNIIRTALAERRGTVKELYSIDDYKITLRGFLIDSNRVFPFDDLKRLKNLFEMCLPFQLDHAISNIFLQDQQVIMTSLELPEVEGGRKHVRPFVMQLESCYLYYIDDVVSAAEIYDNIQPVNSLPLA